MLKFLFSLLLLTSISYAETTKTVFNPFTSNLDYITALDTTSTSGTFILNQATLQTGATFYVSSGTITNRLTLPGNGANKALVVGTDNNLTIDTGTFIMSNGSGNGESLFVFNRIGTCQQGGANCPSSGTLDLYFSNFHLGLYRNADKYFLSYNALSGATEINNVFGLDKIAFQWETTTIAYFDSTRNLTLNYGIVASTGTIPQLQVSTLTFTGGGAPPDSQALCLLSGRMGHCTSVVGIGGGCTCTAP